MDLATTVTFLASHIPVVWLTSLVILAALFSSLRQHRRRRGLRSMALVVVTVTVTLAWLSVLVVALGPLAPLWSTTRRITSRLGEALPDMPSGSSLSVVEVR